eukprot:6190429-Pleurochrysis_carterae.AAC.3
MPTYESANYARTLRGSVRNMLITCCPIRCPVACVLLTVLELPLSFLPIECLPASIFSSSAAGSLE